MINKKIFVACDTSSLNNIKKIINQIKTNKLKLIPKFGLSFFTQKMAESFFKILKKTFGLI